LFLGLHDGPAKLWPTRLRFTSARQEPSVNITPDFSNWKKRDAFERAFAPPTHCFGTAGRLEKDLRTNPGK
jgi:hypothetical protein